MVKNVIPELFARPYSDGQSPYEEFQGQPFPRTYSEGPHVKFQQELNARTLTRLLLSPTWQLSDIFLCVQGSCE